jgi:L-malate glycosyltransferase
MTRPKANSRETSVCETVASHNDHQAVRVCHVAMGDLWAGAEVQLLTLVEDLQRRSGLDISVVLFNDGRLADQLRSLGVPLAIFPEAEWNALKIARELTGYFRKGRFHILHTHKYKDTFLSTLAALRTGVPYIVRTVHGLTEPFHGVQALRMRINELLESCAIRFSVNRLIAVSSQIEKVLTAKYGGSKVVKIHNGVRLQGVNGSANTDDTKKKLGLDAPCRIIGTVGRLTAVKGQDVVLLSARELLHSAPDLHFVLVGDGPLRARLEAMAGELRISHRVTFLGHRDDVYDLMRAMDIFVLPSLDEGIPMVLLEAMALAQPVVASRVGGIPEVVTDRVHGLLVSPGNPSELTEACKTFLDDPAFTRSCAQAGQLRVEREFSSTTMGARVASLYRDLVNDREHGHAWRRKSSAGGRFQP